MEKLFIIKLGGNILDDREVTHSFLEKFAAVPGKKILVHGGGKIATTIGRQLGIESKYINGRRITDQATVDLVTMVYGGLINKKLVAKLQSLHCNAIGFTGADANLVPAVKRPVKDIDYGFAGDIIDKMVGADTLQTFLQMNLVPVFAPLTHDSKGQLLNTNADTIASSVAVSLAAFYQVRLIYCFEKKGVLENLADENSIINLIDREKYTALLQENKLADGILPKIDNAFAAIDGGVAEVLVGHAADLLANVSKTPVGTLIIK